MTFACKPRKAEECATVQARMLEELRVADSLHDHLRDEAAMARHVQRLRALCAELRAMDIEDAGLREAVEQYLASIESLAAAFARASRPEAGGGTRDAGPAGPDAGSAEGGRLSLGALLSTHSAAVNRARSAISRACGAR